MDIGEGVLQNYFMTVVLPTDVVNDGVLARWFWVAGPV